MIITQDEVVEMINERKVAVLSLLKLQRYGPLPKFGLHEKRDLVVGVFKKILAFHPELRINDMTLKLGTSAKSYHGIQSSDPIKWRTYIDQMVNDHLVNFEDEASRASVATKVKFFEERENNRDKFKGFT